MIFANDRTVALTELSVGRASSASAPRFIRGVGVACSGVAAKMDSLRRIEDQSPSLEMGSTWGGDGVEDDNGDGEGCWRFGASLVERRCRGYLSTLQARPFQSWC